MYRTAERLFGYFAKIPLVQEKISKFCFKTPSPVVPRGAGVGLGLLPPPHGGHDPPGEEAVGEGEQEGPKEEEEEGGGARRGASTRDGRGEEALSGDPRVQEGKE